jgi:hypothetical protein
VVAPLLSSSPSPPSKSTSSTSSSNNNRKYGISSLKLGVRILQIWSVDAKNETFKVALSVRCRWRCPEEHVESALCDGLDRLDEDWVPKWAPHVGVWATVEKLHEAERNYYAERQEGVDDGAMWINYVMQFAVTVAEIYDLRHCPFDVQDLDMRVCVFNVPRIEPLPDTTGHAVHVELSGMLLPNYELLKPLAALWHMRNSENASAPPCLHINSYYRRSAQF